MAVSKAKKITLKKRADRLPAQDCPDVIEAHRALVRHRPALDPDCLVIIDEDPRLRGVGSVPPPMAHRYGRAGPRLTAVGTPTWAQAKIEWISIKGKRIRDPEAVGRARDSSHVDQTYPFVATA